MRDDMDRAIDEVLRDAVNEPARPGTELLGKVRTAADARAKARRGALLLAAGAGLALNAALVLLLAATVAAGAGGGWVSAAAVLAGLTLATLPAVPLLAAGDMPLMLKK